MAITLNHTIVPAHDKEASAEWFAKICRDRLASENVQPQPPKSLRRAEFRPPFFNNRRPTPGSSEDADECVRAG